MKGHPGGMGEGLCAVGQSRIRCRDLLDITALVGTNPMGTRKLKLDECIALYAQNELWLAKRLISDAVGNGKHWSQSGRGTGAQGASDRWGRGLEGFCFGGIGWVRGRSCEPFPSIPAKGRGMDGHPEGGHVIGMD